MIRRKISTKTKLLGLISLTSLATLLSACTPTSPEMAIVENATYRTFSQGDFLRNTNTPLNPVFSSGPISDNVGSSLIGLLTYETTGESKFSEHVDEMGNRSLKIDQQPKDNLRLEGALKVEIFEDENDSRLKNNKPVTSNGTNGEGMADSSNGGGRSVRSAGTGSNGKKAWVFKAEETAKTNLTEIQGYSQAISKGKVYRFTINTKVPWVDSRGQIRDRLSGKDFERAISAYYLASQLGFNRNGYFLDLLGLDIEKTIGQSKSNGTRDNGNGQKILPTSEEFDVNKFNATDDTFTIYLKEPYTYTLDLLSKEYFKAIPHRNRKVQNIKLGNNSPIALDQRRRLDQANTNFNEIFGAGSLGNFLTDETWFAGAYYITDYTANQLIFRYNQEYANSAGMYFANKDEKKIQRIILTFGSGNAAAFYELFKSGQADVAGVPEALTSEAVRLFKDNGLHINKATKLSQSNYISFTPRAYIPSDTGPVTNANISTSVADFLWRFNSKDSYIVRAGINGLINHSDLARINLPSSADFQLSRLPYGTFDRYYEAVSNSKLYGSLPRPYTDYSRSTQRLFDQDNNGFEVAYYNFGDDTAISNGGSSGGSAGTKDIKIEKLNINKTTFKQALNRLGATTTNPFVFGVKFAETNFSNNYRDYLNELARSVGDISDGLIQLNIIGRNAPAPSLLEWFTGQQSPLGFSIWGPDYNGVGTWLESFSTVQQVEDPKPTNGTGNGQQTKTIEAAPSTNSHNAFDSYIQDLVIAVKLMGYGYDSSKSMYCKCKDGTSQAMCMCSEEDKLKATNGMDPYSMDDRIQKAFSDDTLKTLYGDKFFENGGKEAKNKAPGIRYGEVAISFLNYLLSKKVIDQTKFDAFVKDPSKLSTNIIKKPKSNAEIVLTSSVIKENQSGNFSKYLGEFAGISRLNELWATTASERDYSFIPRSETGINQISISLLNPKFTTRNSSVSSSNYRDHRFNG